MTNTSVFQYPGGKSWLAPWIIDHFPQHRCYVEVFAGSAAVLVNKPQSYIEVINDRDGDIVQFFEVLRARGDELADWLKNVPYAHDVQQEWADEFYRGERPDDPIERAGRFFFLRNTQYAGKYRSKSGFRSGRNWNKAQHYANNREELREFRDRFEGVQIENRDFEEIFDRFDAEDTLFYCDPPYVEEGDSLYTHGEFDHERFVETVRGIEGLAAISYMDLPPGLEEWYVSEKDTVQQMNKGRDGRRETAAEKLVMNYDPKESPTFSETGQATLSDIA